jgi:N-acetylglucosamine-6-phosphate deacetylase
MTTEPSSLIGRLPGTSSVIQAEWTGSAISAVDELIRPPQVTHYISPGFIDLQVNGFAGVDFNDPGTSPPSIAEAIQALFRTGVTRFFPTIITASEEHICACLRNLATAKKEFLRHGMPEGEAMEAFHVEGPFISSENGPRGAHPIEHVRPPDFEEVKRWQQAANDNIRLITVSPEWDQAPDFIRSLIPAGIAASIGHTAANSEQITAAVDAGATLSTHLGNAAHPTLPKTQNYIYDQLAEDRLSASFIVDGIHIPDHFIRTAVRAKGTDRSILVTDAVMPAMCEPGPYRLGTVEVELRPDGSVVMRGQDRLAGSALRMDRAISNVIHRGKVSLSEAITMATVNPARGGRVGGRRRGLSPGEKADLVLFDYENARGLRVLETVLGGTSVFRAGVRV